MRLLPRRPSRPIASLLSVSLVSATCSCTHTAVLEREDVLVRPEETDGSIDRLVGFTTTDGRYHAWTREQAAEPHPDADEIGVLVRQLPNLGARTGQAIVAFAATAGSHVRGRAARAYLVGADSIRITGRGDMSTGYGTFAVEELDTLAVRRLHVGRTVATASVLVLLGGFVVVHATGGFFPNGPGGLVSTP